MRSLCARRFCCSTLALAGLWALFATPAQAEFRFDEIEPRDYRYNDEYFINIYSYRARLTHRWHFAKASLGYDVTAGSLRNDELYLDHRAILRFPFHDNFNGEFRFEQKEDYDNRYWRAEVELMLRFFRPESAPPMTDAIGNAPPGDGLFFGGQGVLDPDKEFSDIGIVLGYRNEWIGIRLDAISIDPFFNAKNGENGEYTSDAYTLKATAIASLLEGAFELEVWFKNDLPLRLELPQRNNGLTFRYRQLRSGLTARWKVSDDIRVDVDLWMERTRKRRRAFNDPDLSTTDDVNRGALKLFGQLEMDVETFFEEPSRPVDVFYVGFHLHLLDEKRRFPRDPLNNSTVGRGESYIELGYLLALPSPIDDVMLGARVSAYGGVLHMRDVEPAIFKHTVTTKFMAKLGLGLEVAFREDFAFAFFQFTFRADDQTFGGGNAQVMMRF